MSDSPAAQLRPLNAILRVAARNHNLLQREAFEELAGEMRRLVDGAEIAIVLHDGPDHFRLYAFSQPAAAVIAFGVRIPAIPANRARLERGVTVRCDDTRLGGDLERRSADAGYLSYVAVPFRGDRGRGDVIGELIVAFRDTGGAARAPQDLLEAVAAIVGENIERSKPSARDRRLAMILETSGDAMVAWDKEGMVTDANAAASLLTGLPRDELIGAVIREILVPLPDPRSSSPAHGERLEIRAGARRLTVAATITAVDDDPFVAAHALLRDLSEVVAAEREAALHLARARSLEEQHRTLLDNAPLIIFRLDPGTAELRYLNRHAERLLGVPTAEALRTPGFLPATHATAEGRAAFEAALERARLGRDSLPYEARLRRSDGAEITARGTIYPLLAEEGGVVAIEGVLADVSAEHAARTRLVQADRLSTLGTLAAGVAHEINNPAAFILLGIDMLDRLLRGPGVRMEEAASANAGELLRELRDSIKRIVDIARDLRLFASPPAADEGRRAVVDVSRTVESALTLTRGQILERARIVLDLQEVPPVLMDDGRLGQVVVNLLVNAAQSIPRPSAGDQSVTVATRSHGATVEISVTDTGAGIDEENLRRIWTPFFTTKGPDLGTGLGLSISREIVERAGGAIRAESPAPGSDPPRGSRFTISLPAAGRGEEVTPIRSPVPRVRTLPARVLVVEDEAALARALAEELGRVHEVVVAGGAEVADRLLREERWDVVLCDLRMPGMSGEALFAQVEERDPAQAQRFIFMTGVGFGADVERFLAASGRPLLEKPFAAVDVLEAIGKLLARAAPLPEARAEATR